MKIDKAGSVGIGAQTAGASLAIRGGGDLVLEADDPGDLIFRRSDGAQKGRIWAQGGAGEGLFLSTGDNVPDLTIGPNGNVGIGTATPGAPLEVAGDIWARDVILTSDLARKAGVTPLTAALECLRQVRGVAFEWLPLGDMDGWAPGPRSLGVIAQEVEAVLPGLVHAHGADGHKGVRYGGLLALLVEACKELLRRVEALEHTSPAGDPH